jgi:hypothetical protein
MTGARHDQTLTTRKGPPVMPCHSPTHTAPPPRPRYDTATRDTPRTRAEEGLAQDPTFATLTATAAFEALMDWVEGRT